MLTIFLRILKDRRISILVYSIAGILLIWMYVAMFPGIKESASQFNDLLQNYPEGFLKVFNIEELNFTRIENFLSIEHFSIVWPLVAIFFSISFATLSLSTDIERGTIELPLAQPISRTKLFFGRYFAGLTAIALFTIFSILAAIPLCELSSVDYNISNFLKVTVLSFLFAWAVFSVGFLFSALFSERSKTFMGTGLILIVMYILNLIASLKESMQNLKYASFFHYYDYNAALINNSINGNSVLIFAGVIVVCTICSVWWFNRRDIAV